MNNSDLQEVTGYDGLYSLEKACADGSILSIRLSGDETFSTHCPKCDQEMSLSFDDFFEIMRDGDVFSTSVLCSHCSAIHRRLKSGAQEKQLDQIGL